MNILASVNRLPDRDLLSRLAGLARHERDATVELIAHLAELDARKLYRAEGYGSLFRYCTDALRLSEHAAYCRIEAAHIARAFPIVLDRLADGALNLTTLGLIGPHLREENHLELLAQAAGRSKRDVLALVARLAPRPDVPASVRRLPAGRLAETLREVSQPSMVEAEEVTLALRNGSQDGPPALPQAAQDVFVLPRGSDLDDSLLTSPGPAPADDSLPAGPAPAPPSASAAPQRPVIAPLAPHRYRIQFTIGQQTHDTLRQAQDLLRGDIPDGDLALIFDRALSLLLEDTVRKKVGAASKPRAARNKPGSRHIPADVKRKVWVRDNGQCAFVAKSGRRCTERSFLEFHHIEPYGIGGETVTRNISLRCRTHNIYEAELAFGPDVVTSRITARQSETRDRTRSGPSAGKRNLAAAPARETGSAPSAGHADSAREGP